MGGKNIYPMEFETVLYEHEAVAKCAVFGVPASTFGEVSAAHVRLKPGGDAAAETPIAHCRPRLAEFKRPRLIEFVTDSPKTPICKTQKMVRKEPNWLDRNKKF